MQSVYVGGCTPYSSILSSVIFLCNSLGLSSSYLVFILILVFFLIAGSLAWDRCGAGNLKTFSLSSGARVSLLGSDGSLSKIAEVKSCSNVFFNFFLHFYILNALLNISFLLVC